MVENINSIIALFSVLAFKGINIYQEKSVLEGEKEDLGHHVGNLVNNLSSQVNRQLNDADKLKTVRFIVQQMKDSFEEWRNPQAERKEEVSITEAFDEVNRIKPFAAYPITIESDLDPSVRILADKRRLIRCLCELINNSRKSITSSRTDDYIKVTATTSVGRLYVIADDTGEGLSEEKLEQIQRGKIFGHGYHPGGLYYVCSYIRKLNGSIKLLQKNGSGTKLEISLPLS